MIENYSLTEAVDEFLIDRESRCQPETTKTYRFTLGQFMDWFGDKPLGEIDRGVLRRYFKFLRERLAPTSREAQGKTIGALLRFCFAEELCEPFDLNHRLFPTAKVPETPIPSTEDVLAFLGAANGNLRNRTIVLLLIDSAIRRKETCYLSWGDVDFEGHRMMVLGKNGELEPAYIGESTASILAEYKERSGNPSDEAPVFSKRGGGRLRRYGLSGLFRRLSKLASEQSGRNIWITPHQLRRYALTELVRNGTDAFELMAMARHKRIQTTLRYVRLVDDDIRKAHRRASPVDKLLNGNGR